MPVPLAANERDLKYLDACPSNITCPEDSIESLVIKIR